MMRLGDSNGLDEARIPSMQSSLVYILAHEFIAIQERSCEGFRVHDLNGQCAKHSMCVLIERDQRPTEWFPRPGYGVFQKTLFHDKAFSQSCLQHSQRLLDKIRILPNIGNEYA